MKRIIPKIINKEKQEQKDKSKKHIDGLAVLDTTKKALAGAAAVGIIGLMVHGGGLINTGIEQNKSEAALVEHLTLQGYHAANHDYKAAQIRQLIVDCNAGLISIDELEEQIKDTNLTELDFDIFAKTYLDEEQYSTYLSLKKDHDKKLQALHGHANGAVVSTSLALVMASGLMVSQAAIEHKKKKDRRKALREEAKKYASEANTNELDNEVE